MSFIADQFFPFFSIACSNLPQKGKKGFCSPFRAAFCSHEVCGLEVFSASQGAEQTFQVFLDESLRLMAGGTLEPCMLTPWQMINLFGVRQELVRSPLVSHAEYLDHAVANVHPKT